METGYQHIELNEDHAPSIAGTTMKVVEIPARTEDEPRFMVVGMISEKYWYVVITYRDERVRIISARRARVEEVAIYES